MRSRNFAPDYSYFATLSFPRCFVYECDPLAEIEPARSQLPRPGFKELPMPYCAAFGSSTPSILTREVLGFVFRLPRWYDRCLPLTYTTEVVSAWVYLGRNFCCSRMGWKGMNARLCPPVVTAIVTVSRASQIWRGRRSPVRDYEIGIYSKLCLSFLRYDFAESALAKKTNRSDRQELAAISVPGTPRPPLVSTHASFARSSLSGFPYCNLQAFSVDDAEFRPSLASLAFVADWMLHQMLHQNS